MTVQSAPVIVRRRRLSRYLAPAALAILVALVVVVIVSTPGRSGLHSSAAGGEHSTRRLSPYWVVRPGETFTQIARKTGLTVAQLEAFNPQADPSSLVPGQRLNLWLHPPVPRPRPPGPQFWTVRPGDSFGSIAAKTGIDIVKLEQLNPQLKPTTLQPGDRIRLRP